MLQDSGTEPLLDESQHPSVLNPLLEKLHQIPMIDGVKIILDIGIKHIVHFPVH
jgi:hypothetical protein